MSTTPGHDATPAPADYAARARRARASTLAEQGFDATCVWVLGARGPGAVVEWPAAAEALYGVSAREALGRPRDQLRPGAHSAPVHETWAEAAGALGRDGRWEGELVHTLDDGRRVLTDTRLIRVAAPDAGTPGGRPAHAPPRHEPPLVVEIARDVTGRRVAEEALRASQDRLAAIINSALDAIVTVDEEQRVVLFNAAAERLFGVPAADALGEPLDRFIPARFRGAHWEHVRGFGATRVLSRGMARPHGRSAHDGASQDGAPADGAPFGSTTTGPGGLPAREGTVLALRADGTEFPIEAAISQVETSEGRLYTVIVRDVTERVQAEAERARLFAQLEAERARLAETARLAEVARAEADAARQDAEAASHAKSAFLATMSHELRTPLNAVLGYAELLDLGLAGPVSDGQRQYLERIGASGRHLLGLINDVLDLAKIEAGHMTVARQRCAVRGAVRSAVGLVRPQVAARAMALAEHGCGAPEGAKPDDAGAPGPADDGPAYLGDEHRVRQILVNLLSNAVKYTEPGGRVVVSCGTVAEGASARGAPGAGPWVTVRVADTGIGIPREHHESVFGRFQQVEQTAAGPYRRTQGGTGLGLAISRELARLMGGDLTLESEVGRGSTFTLWLPAAPTAEAAPAEPAAAPRAAVGPLLADAVRPVVAAWVDRMRADPLLPHAAAMSRAELEDHTASFLADFAQQFVIFDDAGAPGAARVALVRDGAAVRRLLAERHGALRARQGWDEAAHEREFALLGEEIERVLAARLADVPPGAVDDARALVRAWLADAARESAEALRAAPAGGAGGR